MVPARRSASTDATQPPRLPVAPSGAYVVHRGPAVRALLSRLATGLLAGCRRRRNRSAPGTRAVPPGLRPPAPTVRLVSVNAPPTPAPVCARSEPMAAGPVPSIPEPEAGLDLSIPWPCRWFGHQPMATDPA